MSTLTSASTDAQVWAAYDDNASWEEDASVGKAKAFITACRFLLRRMSEQSQHGMAMQRAGINLQSIQAEMDEARGFVNGNDTTAATNTAGAGTRFFDFQEFRN